MDRKRVVCTVNSLWLSTGNRAFPPSVYGNEHTIYDCFLIPLQIRKHTCLGFLVIWQQIMMHPRSQLIRAMKIGILPKVSTSSSLGQVWEYFCECVRVCVSQSSDLFHNFENVTGITCVRVFAHERLWLNAANEAFPFKLTMYGAHDCFLCRLWHHDHCLCLILRMGMDMERQRSKWIFL